LRPDIANVRAIQLPALVVNLLNLWIVYLKEWNIAKKPWGI
jgi:hypothetical protein